MSHSIAPHELGETATEYGDTPFLLYAHDNGSVRANHVHAQTAIGEDVVWVSGFGRGVLAATEAGKVLSLLWQPVSATGFSLIADGLGAVIDDDTLEITISSAVLHRPAPVDGASTSC